MDTGTDSDHAIPAGEPGIDEMARGYASRMVRSGFETRANIIESVYECVESEAETMSEGALGTVVERAVDDEIGLLVSEQEQWERPTQSDHLDRVFEELRGKGILALHNFSCCGSCASGEAQIYLDYERAQGRAWRGYVYYHEQDTESAVDGGGLCLGYGSSEHAHDHEDSYEDAAVEVASEVADLFDDRGFGVQWDRTFSKRIQVELDWKRVWPPRASDEVPAPAMEMYARASTGASSERSSGGFGSSIGTFIRKLRGR